MRQNQPATISDLHKGWIRVTGSQRIEVEVRWVKYSFAKGNRSRRAQLTWFLKSLKNEEFDENARMNICCHLIRHKNNLPEEFRIKLEKVVRKLSKRQRKILKLMLNM